MLQTRRQPPHLHIVATTDTESRQRRAWEQAEYREQLTHWIVRTKSALRVADELDMLGPTR